MALGRKNWLFAGSKAGGDRAAAIYSVIETAKLNGLEPQAYIANVIAKIAGNWPAAAGMNSCPGTGGQISNRSQKPPEPRPPGPAYGETNPTT